jgi:HSP20 family protein
MAKLLKHESHTVAPSDPERADVMWMDPFDRRFRLFDLWPRWVPFGWPFATREGTPDAYMPVDEFREGEALVIRAELPGIDPETDVELTVASGMLQITAERRESTSVEDAGYVRRELHYGSFGRTLALPEGVTDADVSATYKDGILEIRVPMPMPEPTKKIAVSKG